jgi:hypothetical protein
LAATESLVSPNHPEDEVRNVRPFAWIFYDNRRIGSVDWRQVAGEAFHLNRCELAATAPREARSADVAGQYVRIAVDAKRLVVLGSSGSY